MITITYINKGWQSGLSPHCGGRSWAVLFNTMFMENHSCESATMSTNCHYARLELCEKNPWTHYGHASNFAHGIWITQQIHCKHDQSKWGKKACTDQNEPQKCLMYFKAIAVEANSWVLFSFQKGKREAQSSVTAVKMKKRVVFSTDLYWFWLATFAVWTATHIHTLF